MSIYIISNREVVNQRFSSMGYEKALRTFRVAKCEVVGDGVEYELLPDLKEVGYKEVVDLVINGKAGGGASELKGSAAMFYDIYTQMCKVNDRQSDCLFFIHGFANRLETNLEHIKRLHDIYIAPEDSGIDHLIFVAWPTIGHKVGTYWNDQNDAEETGIALAALFSKLYGFFIDLFEIGGQQRCSNRIHLAAHSMGNTVLDYMLKFIDDYKLFNLFGEVLLLYPDVRNSIFDPGGSFRKLEVLATRTHIYISKSDDVLGIISKYTKNINSRLGHRGPRDRSVLNDETFVVDTTNAGVAQTARERILDHWGYLERDVVVRDVKMVLAGVDEHVIVGRRIWERGYYYLEL